VLEEHDKATSRTLGLRVLPCDQLLAFIEHEIRDVGAPCGCGHIILHLGAQLVCSGGNWQVLGILWTLRDDQLTDSVN
jgi:hypothetical protein